MQRDDWPLTTPVDSANKRTTEAIWYLDTFRYLANYSIHWFRLTAAIAKDWNNKVNMDRLRRSSGL